MRTAAYSLVSLLLAATAASADCPREITSIREKLPAFGAYHVKAKSIWNGEDHSYTGKVIPHSAFDITTTRAKFVHMPEGTWIDTGGGWSAAQSAIGTMMRELVQQGMTEAATNISDAECLGQQSYEGGSFAAYKYKAKGQLMGFDTALAVTLYADQTGKPAWLLIEGDTMGLKSSSVQQFTFDNSIAIAAPM